PSHLGAYYTRMEALFDIAEFCESLVYAHRGLRRRRHFKNAVLLANGTVDNCVGANVSADVVSRMQPWIARLEAHRRDLLDKLNEEEDEFEGIDEDQDKFKVDDPEARLVERHRKLDRRMASLYLGPSCSDKGFLKGLVRHRALPSANKGGSVLLVAETRDFLDRLQSQQDALRTRKPLYVVRAQARAALTVARLEENWREVLLRRCLARRMAYFMLRGLHEARLCRDYPSFFRLVERARDRMEELGEWLLPGREMFLEGLYRMVARAYLDPRNLQRLCGESEARQEAYLRRALGLRLRGKLPRDSELAWPRCLDVRAALDKCRWRLALASSPLEILWIFHELCKHFLQIRRYDLASFKTLQHSKEFGLKLQKVGLYNNQQAWAIHSLYGFF
ncbi:tetratricopeptide repeat protein 25-like, partial [Copidosoma floridanum]|uniref:tetratricopeptide repeat protein 25-like n=1 Tax=Copidosoma floridanum TaxID=29053 RepID=UPI0006C957F0